MRFEPYYQQLSKYSLPHISKYSLKHWLLRYGYVLVINMKKNKIKK